MNIKTRLTLIKEITNVGTKLVCNGDKIGTVTKVSDFNCYVDNIRYSWTSIEKLLRGKTFTFELCELQDMISK